MIGPKKLSTIRRELHRAMTTSGDDPLRWLEERMAVPAHEGVSASGESEVLQSLRRILEAKEIPRSKTPRAGEKK